MEDNVHPVVKQITNADGKNTDDFLEWSSKPRVSLSLCSKSVFEIIQGSQRPSDLDNDQVTIRKGWDDADHNLYSIRSSFLCRTRFKGKTREDGVGHGEDAWATLREKFDDCWREDLRAAHRELETVKIRSD